MKRIWVILLVTVVFAGCGRQVDQLKAFEKCNYDIASADSVYLGNMDVSKIINKNQLDLTRMPALMLAILRQDVPLRAKINLRIENPANTVAAINQFEYKILHKNMELATGFVDRKITVQPGGGVTVVPININSNVYDLLSDPKNQKAFTEFISGARDGKEKKTMLTLKIRPTLDIGDNQVKNPGYISVDKEITNKILF